MKKGITLISLIVTIVILLIVVSSVTVTTVTITNNSKKTTFAKDLKTIEEAVISEYTTNGVLPVVNPPEYTLDQVKSISSDSDKFSSELAENKDDVPTNTFYKVDLTKLGIKNSSRGNEKTTNDIYVVSSENLNIYYLKGLKTSDNTYFSITNALIKGGKITKKANEGTGSSDTVLANGIKLSKNKKIWTNDLVVKVEVNIGDGETVRYKIAGIVPVNNVVTIDTGVTEILLNSSSITGTDLDNFSSVEIKNKTLTIEKIKNGEVISTASIGIKNLDIEKPTIGNDPPTVQYNSNENILTFTGMEDTGNSQLKEIRYEYITRLSLNNVDEDAYNPQPTINNEYLKEYGKKSTDINKIILPKNIRVISAVWIDNAGNVQNTIKNYSIPIENNNAYVTDGLVLHLDGVNNTGTGHSDVTTVWKDLSSSGNNINLNNFNYNYTSGWLNNGLKFDGINDYIRTPDTGTLSNLTFEICMYSPNTTGIVTWSSGMNTLVLYALNTGYITSNSGQLSPGTNLNINGLTTTLTVVYNIITQKAYYYQDGFCKKTVILPTNSLTFNMTSGQNIFTTYNAASEFKTGNIYNIRQYNKALTETEVKQNYELDKKRFFLVKDSIDDYVKDGLVLHYDGINNTGVGHSNSTNVWKNLGTASNSDLITENMTIGTNCNWMTNGFNITNLTSSGWVKSQKETEKLSEDITYTATLKTGTALTGVIGIARIFFGWWSSK